MPTLLVTRPAVDAQDLNHRLHDLGFETIAAPVMEIVTVPGPALDLTGVQAVLATSANGVRAVAERTTERGLPLYAVGDATARIARDLGFHRVESASGDVDDLARLVTGKADPSAGVLLHAAATSVAGDLAGMLDKGGFRIRREVLYEARPIAELGFEAKRAIRADGVDGVLIYSPRSARIFEDMLAHADLSEAATGMVAFCLSDNVAAALSGPWRRKIVARQPAQESLLDAVATCYH